MRHRRFVACVVAVSAALWSRAAAADEVRVLSSVGIKAVVDALAPRFEQATRHKVVPVFDLAATLKNKIEGGDAFDVAILTPALLDDLIAKGLVVPATRTVVARVGLGLMIRAGARKPDVGTVEAFKRTLLDAPSVTYAAAGASGVAFVATIEKLGIGAAVEAKAKPAASGDEVNANVTSGAAALAVLPVSEILPVKGAELGGVFPSDVQTYIVMAAGVGSAGTRNGRSAAATEFISFLTAPANLAVIKAAGMER